MIIPNLYGRLGNQLFQAACAIGLARTHGLDYHIPDHSVNPSVWPGYLKHLNKKQYYPTTGACHIQEKEHSYHHIEVNGCSDKNIFLSGYWQSYRYFDFCLDEVREAFAFKYERQPKVCAVHIRRGDYFLYPDKHPVVSEHYLNQAIAKMCKEGVHSFLFCSDDPVWANEFARTSGVRYVVSESEDWRTDFEMMLGCDYFIIGNSSYSYWTAMLNPFPDKIVYSPSQENWFGPGNAHLSTKDLLPPSWNQIKY